MEDKRVSHGMYGTRIYRIWAAMKRRCNNKNYHEYYLYGGRGIKYCQVWEHFEPFYNWAIENGYQEGLTIDRIDNDGDYEPGNCRWVDMQYQSNNRRNNLDIKYRGETKTLKEWSRELNLNYKMLYKRYRNGWSPEEMFEIKSGHKRN